MERDIGLSRGAFYKWSKNKPGQETLQKLSEYLETPIDYIVNGNSYNLEDYFSDDEKRKLLLAFMALNDEGKQKLMEYADDLGGMDKYKG